MTFGFGDGDHELKAKYKAVCRLQSLENIGRITKIWVLPPPSEKTETTLYRLPETYGSP